VGILERIEAARDVRPVHFSTETAPRPIDQMISEIMHSLGRVSRVDALSVPAVKRGRELITNLATFPFETVDDKRQVVRTDLFDGNVDPDVPDVVTFAQTFEDLLFESVSYWLKTEFDLYGYPTSARHLDYSTVSPTPPAGQHHPLPSGIDPRSVYWVEGRPVAKSKIIVFHSPNTPLLRDGGRAIRRAVALAKAAEMYANNPRARGGLRPAEGVSNLSDEEVQAKLDEHADARRRNAVAWFEGVEWVEVRETTPADLQLAQLKRDADLDVANAIGVDPEDLGISTTSRTYQNDISRRQDRLDNVLAAYAAAVTGRLSMDDVTWPGRAVRINSKAYLRSDPLTRSQVQLAYLAAGVLTVDEIREAEGLPALAAGTAARLAPLQVQSVMGNPVREVEAA
jgi:hypothetical protein